MNQAEKVLRLINDNPPAACACEMGYLVRYDGKRVLFSDHGAMPPHVASVKRNTAGRCTMARFVYPDNSALVFNWNQKSGARYRLERAQ